tara:strand:- start:4292 stop:4675 length:384 start_codon:yes stop_codon:yes gene_type:complete
MTHVTELTDADVRRELRRNGRTFESLCDRLGIPESERRPLSWRLQNMQRRGLVELREGRWVRIEADRTPQTARGSKNARAKLTEDDVRSIRARRDAGESYASLAREFATSPTNVQLICERKRWTWVD